MSELPTVSGSQAVKAFERLGFALDRVKGAHHVLVKPGHRFHLSVPVHGNDSLKRGTLRSLIRAAGVTVDEFRGAL
jgi:predicted RNA binding protein YcfA (HicA-like mRNA interferase family)